MNIALVSILAGAAGNFVDRVRYGYVIDFIDMHLGFMRWPTYNVADIAITVGVIVLIGDILFNKDSPLAAPPKSPRKALSFGQIDVKVAALLLNISDHLHHVDRERQT